MIAATGALVFAGTQTYQQQTSFRLSQKELFASNLKDCVQWTESHRQKQKLKLLIVSNILLGTDRSIAEDEVIRQTIREAEEKFGTEVADSCSMAIAMAVTSASNKTKGDDFDGTGFQLKSKP